MYPKESIREVKREIKGDFPWPEVAVSFGGFATALIGLVIHDGDTIGLGCFAGLGTLLIALARIRRSSSAKH